jgi:capsular exopolysaccharide synthesis family protein
MPEPHDEHTARSSSDVSTKEQLALRLYRLKLLVIRYWWIVALTVSFGLGIQGYRWSQQIPHYISSSRMIVSGQLNMPQNVQYSEEFQNFYGTQVALMKSQDTINDAVAHVRAMHPEVQVDENASVGAVEEPRTAIFDLQVVANDQKYAQLLLNAVMESFLSQKRSRREHTTDDVVTAITAEISSLQDQIKADEQKILDFQKDNNEAYIEEQSGSTANYLVGLNNEMARLTKERDLLAMGSNATGDADGGASGANNITLASEEANIEKLKIVRDDYGNYLKDKHPKMIALTDAINQEERFLNSLKSNDAQARAAHLNDLDLQIKNLENQISEWNQKSLDLNQRLTTFQQLKAKISREENMYDQLASSFQNLHLSDQIDVSDVNILDEASPGYLTVQSLPVQLTYGALAGALTGFAIIFFIGRLSDEKVDSTFELAESIQVPVIGQIPLTAKAKKYKRLPLISVNDPRHGLIESLRDLRSFILFYSTESRPKSLMICSAEPNEGKSTVVANLAITFAATGQRILLVDADLRRGVLHTLFELPSSPGLSECLESQIPWPEAVQKTKVPTLDLLARGAIPNYPGELLLTEQADLLFQESVAHYDMVLWDSAPLLAADDASNMCPRVDALLFVARARVSSMRAVRSALEILSRRSTRLIGIILNAVQPNQPGYYARYRYKDYYAAAPTK